MSNFIKIGERYINTEQIVTISNDGKLYQIRMSNGDFYRTEMTSANKKLIQAILKGE